MGRADRVLECDQCHRREPDHDPDDDPPGDWFFETEYCGDKWCEGHLTLYCSVDCQVQRDREVYGINAWSKQEPRSEARQELLEAIRAYESGQVSWDRIVELVDAL